MSISSTIISFGKVSALIMIASTAFSRIAVADDFEDSARTVYLLTDMGLVTYKSLLLASNDTTTALTYGVGATVGTQKQMTIEHRVETTKVTFSLPSSSLATSWTSTIIKYRLWAFELGPVVGSVAAKGNRAGTDIFDLVGSGYGGYFGIIAPVGRHSLIQLNAMQVSTSQNIEKKALQVAYGPRLDVELSSRIALTKKNLDATIGYRRRSNSITENGTAYKELQTSTFVGFVTGFDF